MKIFDIAIPDANLVEHVHQHRREQHVKPAQGGEAGVARCRYAIDEIEIAGELGYAPHHNFDEALAATIEWYHANERWWRSVQDGNYRDWLTRNYDDHASGATLHG